MVRELLYVFGFIGILLALGLGAASFCLGFDDGREQQCDERWRRVEYIVPVYRLGCWMAERP